MTQKFQQLISQAGEITAEFSPTTTTFDILNNSTFNLDISFGKISGLSDIFLAPQHVVTGFKPVTTKFSSNQVKWNGTLYITAALPQGGNPFPGQGVAQELTIYGYETGYNAGSAFAMSNVSQPANVSGQANNATASIALSPSGGNVFLNPGSLGYVFITGYTITAAPTSSNIGNIMTISHISDAGVNGSLFYNFNLLTTGTFQHCVFPNPIQNYKGDSIQASIPNMGGGPGLILTVYGYSF